MNEKEVYEKIIEENIVNKENIRRCVINSVKPKKERVFCSMKKAFAVSIAVFALLFAGGSLYWIKNDKKVPVHNEYTLITKNSFNNHAGGISPSYANTEVVYKKEPVFPDSLKKYSYFVDDEANFLADLENKIRDIITPYCYNYRSPNISLGGETLLNYSPELDFSYWSKLGKIDENKSKETAAKIAKKFENIYGNLTLVHTDTIEGSFEYTSKKYTINTMEFYFAKQGDKDDTGNCFFDDKFIKGNHEGNFLKIVLNSNNKIEEIRSTMPFSGVKSKVISEVDLNNFTQKDLTEILRTDQNYWDKIEVLDVSILKEQAINLVIKGYSVNSNEENRTEFITISFDQIQWYVEGNNLITVSLAENLTLPKIMAEYEFENILSDESLHEILKPVQKTEKECYELTQSKDKWLSDDALSKKAQAYIDALNPYYKKVGFGKLMIGNIEKAGDEYSFVYEDKTYQYGFTKINVVFESNNISIFSLYLYPDGSLWSGMENCHVGQIKNQKQYKISKEDFPEICKKYLKYSPPSEAQSDLNRLIIQSVTVKSEFIHRGYVRDYLEIQFVSENNPTETITGILYLHDFLRFKK